MPRFLLFLLLGSLACATLPLSADDAPAPDANALNQLRKAYRDGMLQLRDAQNQAVQLQAQIDQDKKESDDLKAKLESETQAFEVLVKKEADEKALADKTTSDLNDKMKEKDGQIAAFQDAIAKWQDYQKQSEKTAQLLTQDGQNMRAQIAQLQRLVQDRELKNFELYKTASEILTRYEHFSLGDALAAKEPFTGIARTKLQSLVQGYADKIDQNAVKSAQGPVMILPKAPGVTEAQR